MNVKYKRFLFNEKCIYRLSKPKTNRQLEALLKDKPYDVPVRLINIGNGGQGERVYYVNAKSTTLSAMGGGRGAKTGLYLVAQRGRNIVDGKRNDYLGAPTVQRLETRYDGKTNTITTVSKDNYVLIEIDNEYYRIRKLTPIECERLQCLPDGYTKGISDSARYRALGNGWTADIISHILSYFKTESSDR
jgi:site-specific DNA-cytosine methylase